MLSVDGGPCVHTEPLSKYLLVEGIQENLSAEKVSTKSFSSIKLPFKMKEWLRHCQINNNLKKLLLANLPYKKY